MSESTALERCLARSGGPQFLATCLGLNTETIRSWATAGSVPQAPAAILMSLWFGENAEELHGKVLGNPAGLSPEKMRESMRPQEGE